MDMSNLLSDTQVEMLRNNSEALGISASAMIGQLLDDEFGGLPVSANDSAQSIQQHVDMLEWMIQGSSE